MLCDLYLMARSKLVPNIVWNRPGDDLGFFLLVTVPGRFTPAFGGLCNVKGETKSKGRKFDWY